MSYQLSERDWFTPELKSVLSYILLADLLTILGAYGFMTAGLLYLEPSNMTTELMQISIVGNSLGITILASVTLIIWRVNP